MRVLRRLVLLLLAYVALDFANPLMPGAVSFNPDDSVEAVRAAQARTADTNVTVVPSGGPARLGFGREIRSAPGRVAPSARSSRERLGHHRRAPAPPPPSPSEDH